MSQDYITRLRENEDHSHFLGRIWGAKKCALLWGWHGHHVDVQHVRPRLNLHTPKVALVGGSGFHKIIPNRRGDILSFLVQIATVSIVGNGWFYWWLRARKLLIYLQMLFLWNRYSTLSTPVVKTPNAWAALKGDYATLITFWEGHVRDIKI